MYDVAVVGGGVIGATILRELTKYRLKVCLLEKESDVCMGASKANSGIVHAGFDAATGSLKASFNVRGSKMMKRYTKQLGVKFVNNGSLVVAYNDKESEALLELFERGKANGVKRLAILDEKKLRRLEPNIGDGAVSALYARTGGIVCPYELTIAAIGNAMDNGAELITDFCVSGVTQSRNGFKLTSPNGENVEAKVVINCAGGGAQRVANLFGDYSFTIGYRRGEYMLLDKECAGLVKRTVFRTPTELGKGILISPTVDGNILLGPTAETLSDTDTDTSEAGLNEVKHKANEMVKNVPFGATVTSFAGVRAFCDRHDFIIERSETVKNLINVSGIESPGLTSAPAIAEYVVGDLVKSVIELNRNPSFNGKREADYFFHRLSDKQKNALIKKQPQYGKIVCRCEQITEGEILRALRVNPKAKDVDGIKRRTRAGMGRCQGGFCQPTIAELISKELNIELYEVTKKGGQSKLLTGKTK